MVSVRFEVDDKKKADLQEIAFSENRFSAFLMRFSSSMAVAAFLSIIGLGLTNLLVEEPIRPLATSLECLLVFFGLATWASVLLAHRIANRNLGERVDEELTLEGDVLHYSFRIRYRSNYGRARNVIIPLDNIRSCYAEPSLGRLSLRGTFSGDYFARTEGSLSAVPSEGNLNDFVLYDYFTPSLNTFLTSGEIHTKR